MTNVKPEDLNYHHYQADKYDKDIINSIPGHKDMHKIIGNIVKKLPENPLILELGVGTGITTLEIAKNSKNPSFILIDFSEIMIKGAKRKLKNYNCKFILDDYSKIDLPTNCDVVVTVIGFHHQDRDEDKQKMIQKVYKSLKKGGVFIFGDLMTYEDQKQAALNDAFHYHFLVENSAYDIETLTDWAFHHRYQNPIVPHETNIKWMKSVGFRTEVLFQKYNTFLLIGYKD